MRTFVAMVVVGAVVMAGAAPALAQFVELPFTQRGPESGTGRIATPVRPAVSRTPVSVTAPMRPALVQSLADIGLR